jgi:heme exporter protein C
MTHLIVNVKRYTLIRNLVFVWLTAVLLAGFLLNFPKINILEHTARNLYFHVPMWFTMMAAAFVSGYHSLKVLKSGHMIEDIRALQAARVGTFFGLLGLSTGIVWSKFTWYVGSDVWWNFDPRQIMVTIQLLIYGGYFVLRSAFDEPKKRAKISAVFNLFAMTALPFLLYVIPRQMQSLHPGAEGNPAFSQITHPVMRLVFYPAIIGFIGLFWVLYTQRVRVAWLKFRVTQDSEM